MTLIARIFLAVVGAVYMALGIWCSVMPQHTSQVVGFDLKPGSGQSEFLTVYGGLEFGLGLAFLVPLVRPESTASILLACLLSHGGIVVFRTIGWFLFTGISSTTVSLAVVEWVIFVAAAVIYGLLG
jgi:Domain of unknown function (DUF4345)